MCDQGRLAAKLASVVGAHRFHSAGAVLKKLVETSFSNKPDGVMVVGSGVALRCTFLLTCTAGGDCAGCFDSSVDRATTGRASFSDFFAAFAARASASHGLGSITCGLAWIAQK